MVIIVIKIFVFFLDEILIFIGLIGLPRHKDIIVF
jgi:hypothetical protein